MKKSTLNEINNPLLNSDTSSKVLNSHKQYENINETPSEIGSITEMENGISTHYSCYCYALQELKINKTENFYTLCTMKKDERFKQLTVIFPWADVDTINILKHTITVTNNRFDCIEFYESPTDPKDALNEEKRTYRRALWKTAELLKEVKVRDHPVWSTLMGKFINQFTRMDLNFVGVLITMCASGPGAELVISFCSQYYMFKAMGIDAGIHMVHLLNEPGNMTYILESIRLKINIATTTVPETLYIKSVKEIQNVTSSLSQFVQDNGLQIGWRVILSTSKSFCFRLIKEAMHIRGWGFSHDYIAEPILNMAYKQLVADLAPATALEYTAGEAGSQVGSGSLYDTFFKPIKKEEAPIYIPLIKDIEEPKLAPHPFAFSGLNKESQIAKALAEGSLSVIYTGSYYLAKAALAPAVGRNKAFTESGETILKTAGESAANTYKTVKKSFSED